mmetsp:Transcript_10911/g.36102  ORF Transcript_10911/g.36102 Transcript_10911/m.36102 type:complete len:314 (+) Transcript_10911:1743-2684(+)
MEGGQRGRRPNPHLLRRQPAVRPQGARGRQRVPRLARPSRGPAAARPVAVPAALPPLVRDGGDRGGAGQPAQAPHRQLVRQPLGVHRRAGRRAARQGGQRLHRRRKDEGDCHAVQDEGRGAGRLMDRDSSPGLLAPALALRARRVCGQAHLAPARAAAAREAHHHVGLDAVVHRAALDLNRSLAQLPAVPAHQHGRGGDAAAGAAVVRRARCRPEPALPADGRRRAAECRRAADALAVRDEEQRAGQAVRRHALAPGGQLRLPFPRHQQLVRASLDAAGARPRLRAARRHGGAAALHHAAPADPLLGARPRGR